ncbi:MAG: NotI family restriction endonuclease [Ktedonobacterales bacterium]
MEEDALHLPKQPLAEVFGYPIDSFTAEAQRHRRLKLCPYNNKVPNCTKSRAKNPIGVCSVFDASQTATITCPVRFRQDWYILEHAAAFFFPPDAQFTSLMEVRLKDRYGKSAGNIDLVLVSYDDAGRLTGYGSVEVQAVYISGTVSTPFTYYMQQPEQHSAMDWRGHENYPRPDYLSSSRKRLAPQLIYKGGILHTWGRKMAVAVDSQFYATLPSLDEVSKDEADLAWLIYDLQHDMATNQRRLTLARTVYTRFDGALAKITQSEAGDEQDFLDYLQERLDNALSSGEGEGSTPDTASLHDSEETC